MSTRKILFLCTGNFYRSRFAEEWFNHLAAQASLAWRADSRGLSKNPYLLGNRGPISPLTVQELAKRSVRLGEIRFPKILQPGEAAQFERVIALDQDEHRPLLERFYPDLLATVTYWNIKDLGDESSESALGRIDARVKNLLTELANTK